ncbi:hypothetical protein F383_11462 [Gossypium arboreum]|uniref:Uncharacterized protein n=1 Tax=Gossypium arboreum TaxID=29729 RepID=A0A0B0PZS6_GOSAR|nr:hypothetical protein F383_11462 [Gossypium arboreum]
MSSICDMRLSWLRAMILAFWCKFPEFLIVF